MRDRRCVLLDLDDAEMIEEMKQWLEALEIAQDHWRTYHGGMKSGKIDNAITSLRQAIEQAEKQDCWCHKCNEGRTVNGFPFSMTHMILCPDCGNKRCPKASDHTFPCTNSNEPGQPGSVYTTPQPQEFVCSTGLCHYKKEKNT